jgi:hypothetical protein
VDKFIARIEATFTGAAGPAHVVTAADVQAVKFGGSGCFRNPDRGGSGIMVDMLTTDYDGCGRCLVRVRRLSRKTDATSSPQRQGDQILEAAADAGEYIIA